MHEISLAVLPSAVQRSTAISRFDNFASASGIKHCDMPKCTVWVSQAILNLLASSSVLVIGLCERASVNMPTVPLKRLNLDSMEGGAQVDNVASFAVMRRLGMEMCSERIVEASTRCRNELCIFYSRILALSQRAINLREPSLHGRIMNQTGLSTVASAAFKSVRQLLSDLPEKTWITQSLPLRSCPINGVTFTLANSHYNDD